MKRFVFGFALLLGLCAGQAKAAMITLQPTDGKDTNIASGTFLDTILDSANNGNQSALIINWGSGTRSVGLIEFDLSSLPNGAQITSATLSLFHTFNGNNQGIAYDIFRVTSAWEESTVTFNSAPTFDPTAVSSMIINDNSSNTLRTWDVTSLVQGWANGAYANYGMWIEEVPVAGSGNAYFASSDADASRRPILTINYVEDTPSTVPEPASVTLLGLGGVFGLLGYRLRRRKTDTAPTVAA